MAMTGDPTYSAARAGYGTPKVRGQELKGKPDIQADIGRRVMAKLASLGELAVQTVHEAMTSKTSTWTNKLTAADMVLKRLERGEGEGDKEPSEMSYDELQGAIRALQIRQAEIADQAKPIIELEASESGVFD